MAIFPTKRTPDQRTVIATTISSAGDGFSEVMDLGGLQIVALESSTAWTAAGLGFHVGRTSGSLIPLLHNSTGTIASSLTTPVLFRISSGSINTSTASVFGFNDHDQRMLSGFRFVRLISNDTDGAAVAQSTPRTFYAYLGVPSGPIK